MKLNPKSLSDSNFADWLRGTKKPFSASFEGWAKWKREAKAAHPVRYWIVEDFFPAVEQVVNWLPDRVHQIRNYIRNRYFDHSHALVASKTTLERGVYTDFGYKLLPCIFSGLVDYVECDKAWMHVVFSDENFKKYAPAWYKFKILRWKKWRCPEAGIKNLEWETSLVYNEDCGVQPGDQNYGLPTPQAIAAKEVLELYYWFTQVYVNRPDPYDSIENSAGDFETEDGVPVILLDNPPADVVEEFNSQTKTVHQIHEQYEKEDTEMLIRLIKIRENLWT